MANKINILTEETLDTEIVSKLVFVEKAPFYVDRIGGTFEDSPLLVRNCANLDEVLNGGSCNKTGYTNKCIIDNINNKNFLHPSKFYIICEGDNKYLALTKKYWIKIPKK